MSKPGPSQRDSGVTNVMLIKLLDIIIPKQHNICMSTEIHAMQRGVHVCVCVCVTHYSVCYTGMIREWWKYFVCVTHTLPGTYDGLNLKIGGPKMREKCSLK